MTNPYEPQSGDSDNPLVVLEQAEGMMVQQKRELTEVFTGLETKNRYVVTDMQGNAIWFAAEVGTGFLSRNFLKNSRPFTIEVRDPTGQPVMTLNRPWRWFFHEVSMYDPAGALLGTVKRRFNWVRRVYDVLDENSRPIFELFGPILHPWTFQVRRDGQEVGKISKKWSGLAKEMFTKADNFGVTFPPGVPVDQKQVLLGAVFLLDFAHWEQENN